MLGASCGAGSGRAGMRILHRTLRSKLAWRTEGCYLGWVACALRSRKYRLSSAANPDYPLTFSNP